MKFNKLTCIFLLTLFSFNCSSQPEKTNNAKKINEVRDFRRDTLIQNDTISLRTEINIDNNNLVFKNKFKKSQFEKNELEFNINKYFGLSIFCNHSQITDFITFNKDICAGQLINFFAVFNPDSIDNPEGFHYSKVSSSLIDYYILTGYYFGCNGSFCNNRCLLIIQFKEGIIKKGYLIGYDQTIFDPTIIKKVIGKDHELILTFSNAIKNNKLTSNLSISFGDEISLHGNNSKLVDNYGLFGIKK